MTKAIGTLIIIVTLCVPQRVDSQALSCNYPKWDAYITNQNPVLVWNTLPDASFYTVELSPVSDFSTGVITSPPLFTNSWFSSTLGVGTWYWRVNGDVSGDVQTSSPSFFTVYDPALNPALEFWVEASSGIITDMGGRVNEWQDISGNGYVVTQGDSASRPGVNPASINGLPAVTFSGSHFLEGGDILDLQTSNWSILAIASAQTGSGQTIFSKTIAANASGRYALAADPSGMYFLYQDATNRNIMGSYSSQYSLFELDNNRNTSINSFKINNVLAGNINNGGAFNMNSNFRFLLGAYNSSDGQSELSLLNGEISELIFCKDIDLLSLNEIKKYIRDKYSPPLDLGPDMYVNKFCDTTLVATAGYSNILWSTGETTPTIDVNEGIYWVQGTDLFGYTHFDTIHVNYPKIPEPPTMGICDGGTVTWDADLGPGFTYLWSTLEVTPSIDISSAGTYSVEVFDGFGCSLNSGDTTFYVDYYSTTATLGNDTSLCSGNTLSLQIGAAETVSYLWPDLSTQPTYPVDTTGTYFVQAMNVNGCVVQDSIQIIITGVAPVALFTPLDVCQGTNSIFTDESTTEPGNPLVDWIWDFGDTNSDNVQNTSHLYSVFGTYLVTLSITAQDGCTAEFTDTLMIYQNPNASFSITGHCENDTLLFGDLSLNGSGLIDTWAWDFGQPASGSNTSTNQNPSHLYAESNTFNVTLQVTDDFGCMDDTIIALNVDHSPVADVVITDDCLDQVLNVVNNSTIANPDNITGYAWDFGDGTNSSVANPLKFYTNSGQYLVDLVITSNTGCTDNFSDSVLIHALPIPQFSVNNGCVGTMANLVDLSTVQGSTIDSTRWIIDVFDTLYGSPASFVFDTEGDSFIKLTTISTYGCKKDTIKKVVIGPELNASFTTLNSGILVAGTPVSFVNQSLGGDAFLWDFGDTNTSVAVSPIHQYAESYLDSLVTVSLVASNAWGCFDTTWVDFLITTAMLDLSVETLFLNDIGGFYDVAVKMKNIGSVRIEGVDLVLNLSNGTVVSELYPDTLFSNQEVTYILTANPSSVFANAEETSPYVCVTGNPISSQGYDDIDWSNNQLCRDVQGEGAFMIGPNPNPAVDQIVIGLVLPQDEMVSLRVSDERGRLVDLIHDGVMLSSGYHVESIDVSGYQRGMYFITFMTASSKQIVKMIKL